MSKSGSSRANTGRKSQVRSAPRKRKSSRRTTPRAGTAKRKPAGSRKKAATPGAHSRQKKDKKKVTNLKDLLDQMGDAEDGDDRVSVKAIREVIGRRTFGPWLVVAGLITLAPIVGDIPGVPTTLGILVVLIAGQLLFGRESFWLPNWILDRSVDREKFKKALGWLRKPAGFVDHLLRPRLTALTQRPWLYGIAVACFLIGAVMPAMEFVPFSANGAGIALTAFGLALIAHDGLVALIALAVTLTTFGLVIWQAL